MFGYAHGQSITINPAATNEFTIKSAGIGLDVINGSSRVGTAIIGGKAIFQAHTNESLVFRTNNSINNSLAIFNNTLSIGPPIFSAENITVSKGRLRFSGNKDASNASGTEFTNTSGTALRGFVGMADDGAHLGFWGYGNYSYNVRLGASNGYMGIGAINPATRLHINGSMKVLELGHPLTELFVTAEQNGILETRTMNDIYTISAADFVHRVGSTSLPVDTPYGLFYSATSTGTPVFMAPFNVPNGVTLSRIKLGFLDNSATSNLEACLVRVPIGTTDQENIQCVVTSGSSASNTTSTVLLTFVLLPYQIGMRSRK
ncbi:MAG: hypothetical protein EOP51_32885 [Sphingobacteriales bacterium]|nr:MAG: hypothetical protein EOP51_32885 [Sphingobacteriales bacterium]